MVLVVTLAVVPVFGSNDGAASSDDVVADQYIVVLKDGLEGDYGDIVKELDSTYGVQVKQIYTVVLKGFSASGSADKFEKLKKDSRVSFVEPDRKVWADVLPNDPSFSSLWGLHNTGQTGGTPDADIDAPEAWNIQTGSPSVIIAVIDTGVDINHPDLKANIWINLAECPTGIVGTCVANGVDEDGNGRIDDFHGWDFFNNDNTVFDSAISDRHGTHVAGTIAAVGNNSIGVTGINWIGRVMVLKFLGPAGGFVSDAIAAINYAAAKGVKITNNSWGGGGPSLALQTAIANSGTVFVAAAGNAGKNTDDKPHFPSSFDLPNIISVAATDHNDNLAAFSNFGVTSVDLGAPGVSILSTTPNNTYSFFSGTSMAAPHVSGVAGLLQAQFPADTITATKSRILNAVDPKEALAGITVTGGRLNAANALGAIPPPPPTNSAPVAINDSATTNANTPVTIAVLANDTDADGNPLTVTNLTQPANGTAAFNLNNTVTYTPNANFNGLDSFTYTANDGQTNSNVATVTVTVSPVVTTVDVTVINVKARNILAGQKYNIRAPIQNNSTTQTVTIIVRAKVVSNANTAVSQDLSALTLTIVAGDNKEVRFNDLSILSAGTYTVTITVDEDPNVGPNNKASFNISP